ncbi:MAG TPA: ABC transporter permease [Candidatus Omnitrophota bacterium]|nr:ABC transporter permease [Candidatus Omnitrophota bacterium]
MSKNNPQKGRWGAVGMLWLREIVRFYRQPARVAAAILSPFLFWFLIGSGVGRSFSASGESYLNYFFPGSILLVILFAAVFSTISIIEDRREGFLQAVMASPVSRASIPLGKILGSATLAFLQSGLFILLAWVTGIRFSGVNPFEIAAAVALASLLFSTLGFLMAWQFRSVQGFHAMMNMLLMPMWFLSGALFPAEGASVWIQFLMAINPLYYGHQFLSAAFGNTAADASGSALIMSVSVLVLWILAALQVAKKRGMDS